MGVAVEISESQTFIILSHQKALLCTSDSSSNTSLKRRTCHCEGSNTGEYIHLHIALIAHLIEPPLHLYQPILQFVSNKLSVD